MSLHVECTRNNWLVCVFWIPFGVLLFSVADPSGKHGLPVRFARGALLLPETFRANSGPPLLALTECAIPREHGRSRVPLEQQQRRQQRQRQRQQQRRVRGRRRPQAPCARQAEAPAAAELHVRQAAGTIAAVLPGRNAARLSNRCCGLCVYAP